MFAHHHTAAYTHSQIVASLGGTVVEAARECTHLITDKVHRTLKFLECLVGGKVITSLRWLDASARAGEFVGTLHVS